MLRNQPPRPVPYHFVKQYTARKTHECSSCGDPIEPGDKYTRIVEPKHNQAPEVVKLHLPGECTPPEPPKRYGKK